MSIATGRPCSRAPLTSALPSAQASSLLNDVNWSSCSWASSSSRVSRATPARLQPAALGGVEHGLGAVDRAELAVDVVEVRAHGAGAQRQLVGDLLVDVALGVALEDLELAIRQRTRLDRARALRGRVRKVIEHAAELGGPEADRAGGPQQLDGRHRQALRVVGEHVGEADEGGIAGGVVGVVALDR